MAAVFHAKLSYSSAALDACRIIKKRLYNKKSPVPHPIVGDSLFLRHQVFVLFIGYFVTPPREFAERDKERGRERKREKERERERGRERKRERERERT